MISLLIYFLIGVFSVVFYGGLICIFKPSLAPFRTASGLPIKRLKIFLTLIYFSLFIIISLIGLSFFNTPSDKEFASSLETSACFIGISTTIVLWAIGYKRCLKLHEKIINYED